MRVEPRFINGPGRDCPCRDRGRPWSAARSLATSLLLLLVGTSALGVSPAPAQSQQDGSTPPTVFAISHVAPPGGAVAEGTSAVFTITVRGRFTRPATLRYRITPVSIAGAEPAEAADLTEPQAVGEPPRGRTRFPTDERLTFNAAGRAGVNGRENFSLPILKDDRDEGREAFTVTLIGVSGGGRGITPRVARATDAGLSASATVTIAASDLTAVISLAGPDAAVMEGDDAVFPVRVTGTLNGLLSLEYEVSAPAQGAAEARDLLYFFPGQTRPVVFPEFPRRQPAVIHAERAMQNPKGKIRLRIADDTDLESIEFFTVTLVGVSGGGEGVTPRLAREDDPGELSTSATATIAANDQPAVIAITGPDAAVLEDGPAVFTVSVTGTITESVSVRYEVGSSQTAGASPGDFDFPNRPGQASTFPQLHGEVEIPVPTGQASPSATIEIHIAGDTESEGAESFTVTLVEGPADPMKMRDVSPRGGGPGVTPSIDAAKASATATIAASGGRATLSIEGPSTAVREGAKVRFRVRIAGRTTEAVTLNYAVGRTASNSAAENDFGPDDDNRPFARFPRSEAPLSIPPGTTGQFVEFLVPIYNDTEPEGAETFTVTLSDWPSEAGTGITLVEGTTRAIVTIAAGDGPVVSIAGPAGDVVEGDPAGFPVTVTGTTTAEVTVTYTVSATGGAIEAGDLESGDSESRFTVLSSLPHSASLTIPAGVNPSAPIPLQIVDDMMGEGRESFTVTLSNPSGGGTAAPPTLDTEAWSATATIAANDQVFRVSLALADGESDTVIEGPPGDDGSRLALTFAEDRRVPYVLEYTYNLTPAGTRGAGASDLRFIRRSGDSINTAPVFFNPSDPEDRPRTQSSDLEFLALEDGLVEGDEMFTVTLTKVAFARGGRGNKLEIDSTANSVTVTLRDSDLGVAIEPPASPARLGKPVEFPLTFTGAERTGALIVTYDISAPEGEEATAADDFVGLNAPTGLVGLTREIAMDSSALPLTVASTSDLTSFTVTLTAVSGGGTGLTARLVSEASGGRTATATIATSTAVDIAVAAAADVSEGAPAEFVVTATGTTTAPITGLTYAITPGTADAADYNAAGARPMSPLTIPVGTDQSVEIRVPTLDDAVVDRAVRETFSLQLGGPVVGGGPGVRLSLETASVPGAILDNDIDVAIEPPASPARLGQPVEFPLSFVGAGRTGPLTVTYNLSGAGVTAADFVGLNAPTGLMGLTQEITRDSSVLPLTVANTSALTSFTVTLTAVSGGGTGLTARLVSEASGGRTATATIATSTAVDIAVAAAADVSEGAPAEFVVTATGTTTAPITGLTYSITPGTADAADYNAAGARPMSPLTIPVGTDQSVEIRVPTLDDAVVDRAVRETFSLQLGGPVVGGGPGVRLSLETASVPGAILDNDIDVAIEPPASPARLGQPVEFPLSFVGAGRTGPLTVTYNLSGAGVTAADFVGLNAPTGLMGLTQEITRDSSVLPLTVANTSALTSFTVTLTAVSGGGTGLTARLVSEASGGRTATATIATSTAVDIAVAAAADVSEGAPAEFVVTATGTTTAPITGLTYAITPGTADAADYNAAGARPMSPLTIPVGTDQSVEIRVPTLDDAVVDRAVRETFSLQLGGPVVGGGPGVRLSLETASVPGAILDNDIDVAIEPPASPARLGQPVEFPLSFVGAGRTGPLTVTYNLSGAGVTAADFVGLNAPTGLMGLTQEITRDSSVLPLTVANTSALTSFTVTLTAVSGGGTGLTARLVSEASGGRTATATIATSTAVDIAVAAAADVSEGAPAEFVVTATGTTTAPITGLTYAITPGTADAADYNAAGARPMSPLTILQGTNAAVTIRVPTLDDAVVDRAARETFSLQLGGPVVGGGPGVRLSLETTSVPGAILDNDIDVAIEPPASPARLGQPVEFPLSFVGAGRTGPLTVTYNLSGAGVTAADFVGLNAPTGLMGLTQEITRDSSVLPLTVANTSAITSFTVTLTAVRGGGTGLTAQLVSEASGGRTATATIAASTAVGIAVAAAADVAEGATAEFVVTATGTTTAPITGLTYSITPGTADAADYNAAGARPMSPLTILQGTNAAVTIRVPTLDDAVVDRAARETFSLQLGGPVVGGGPGVRLSLETASVPGAILDNDIDVAIEPPASPARLGQPVEFPLSFVGAGRTGSLTVTYNLSGAGVTAADFVGLNAPTGLVGLTQEITRDSSVLPLTVANTSALTSFTVTLTAVSGGGTGLTARLVSEASGGRTATATVGMSDVVRIGVADATIVAEGMDAVFIVTATGTTTVPITGLTYSVMPDTADAADYDAAGATPVSPLTIPQGMDQTVEIRVPTVDDDVEDNFQEIFTVQLGGTPAGGGPGVFLELNATTATGTIMEDDVGVSISGPSTAVIEGGTATFTISRLGPTREEISVTYQISGVAAEDFRDPSDGSLTIPAGDVSAELTLTIIDEVVAEEEETLRVELTGATLAGGTAVISSTAGSATATIAGSDRIEALDLALGPFDPAAPRDAVPLTKVSEGGTATYRVTVRGDALTQKLDLAWKVELLQAGSENRAEKADFEAGAPLSGTLSLPAGKRSVQFTVPIFPDKAVEGDEQFIVEVGPSGINPAVPTQTLLTTIEEDDVGIAIRAPSKPAGEGGPVAFTLLRSGDLRPKVAVFYTVEGGEVDAADYTDLTGGRVEIRRGQREAEIRIQIKADDVDEDDETLRVALDPRTFDGRSNPFTVVRVADTAVVTIPRLEIGVAFSSVPGAVEEGEDANFIVELQLKPRDAVTPFDVVVGYALGGAEPSRYEGRRATPFVDYASPARGEGMLVIPAGQRIGNFAVPVILDGLLEDEEVFSVALAPERSSGGGGTLEVAATPRLVRILDGADQAARREQRTRGMLAATQRSTANMATEVITARMGRAMVSAEPGSVRETRAELPPPVWVVDPGAQRGRNPRGVGQPRYSGSSLSASGQTNVSSEHERGGAERSLAADGIAPPDAPAHCAQSSAANSTHLCPTSQPAAGDTHSVAADAIGTALRLTGLSSVMAAGGDPAAPDPESAALMAGIDTPVRPFETGPAEERYGADIGARDRGLDLGLPSLGQLLEGARFELSGEAMGWGSLGEGLGVWGAGAFHSLKGDPVLGGGRLDYEGESYGFFVGADKRLALGATDAGRELLAGAAVGWTRGDLDFRDEALQAFALEGSFESQLWSLHPYLSLQLSHNARLWLLGGYGWGEVKIAEQEESPDGEAASRRVETDSTLWMASAGAEVSAAIPGLGEASQLTVRLQGTRTGGDLDRARFDDGALLRGTRARTWRAAGELEGSYRVDLFAGGSFRPFVTARVRGDAGDDLGDDWELAVDVGGGAELAWSELGLALGLKGLTQLSHGTGQREHSASVNLSYDLGLDSRGFTVSLDSALAGSGRLGEPANGRGYERELIGSGLAGPGGFTTPGEGGIGSSGGGGTLRHSLQGEIGYGLPWLSFWTPGLLTPYARFELAPHARSYGAGLRFESGDGVSLGVEGAVEVDSGTSTDPTDQPDYQLRVKGEMEF